MSVKMKFSSKVYHARINHGLKQHEVAEAVSISNRWLQRIEKGEVLPGSITMLRLIIFLELDVEDLRQEVGLLVPVPHVR